MARPPVGRDRDGSEPGRRETSGNVRVGVEEREGKAQAGEDGAWERVRGALRESGRNAPERGLSHHGWLVDPSGSVPGL